MIGVTQMTFGVFGLFASIGIFLGTFFGALGSMGYIYGMLLFGGVAFPCLVVGNYVDDLRRWAVSAQIVYSLIAVILSGYFLYVQGISYYWSFPIFGVSDFGIAIGNIAAFIVASQTLIILYLLARWKAVAPPSETTVERDKTRAKLLRSTHVPSPLEPALLAPDGSTLSQDEEQKILGVTKVITEEGMAILCSNCNGFSATSSEA